MPRLSKVFSAAQARRITPSVMDYVMREIKVQAKRGRHHIYVGGECGLSLPTCNPIPETDLSRLRELGYTVKGNGGRDTLISWDTEDQS